MCVFVRLIISAYTANTPLCGEGSTVQTVNIKPNQFCRLWNRNAHAEKKKQVSTVKISVFIIKLDTFGLKKTLNRLELKGVKVRNVESRSTTSLRQLSEQVTEAQNPWAKNRLAFHVFCVSTCLNPQNYNSCHFFDCQVTWAFLSAGKIMVYKFNRFIMNKKESKGQVFLFFISLLQL